MASRGFGVGLHIGYRARAQAVRIAAERERLEAIAETQVTGSRHHYWHMTRPFWASLEAHGRAGLLFDSSVGFNSAPGYRLGVALPFHPWNPETGSVVPTLQIPTLAMDSMLMLPRAASVDAVIERFDGVLAALKRYEGVAALDWHEYTSFPGSTRYRAWGEAYLSLLDHLAGDGAGGGAAGEPHPATTTSTTSRSTRTVISALPRSSPAPTTPGPPGPGRSARAWPTSTPGR